MNDPIVDEIRRIRDEYAASFNYDLDAIYRDLKEKERTSGRTYVSYAPKRSLLEKSASTESSEKVRLRNDPFVLLEKVANDAGPLLQTHYMTRNELPSVPSSFVLTFQNMELTVTAQDDDSVELILGGVGTDSEHTLRSNEEFPWSEAIGKPVRWGWMMTNQQGYQDAVQFEFARNIADTSTIIQLVAVGSSLKVLSVRETQQVVHEKLMAMGS